MRLLGRRPVTKAESLRFLWTNLAGLPDPLHAEPRSLEAFAHRYDKADLQKFVTEWQIAIDLLATPEHAASLDQLPWRGAGEPFGVRRFQLARERTLLGGEEFYKLTLKDPKRLATQRTGPTPTAAELMEFQDPEGLGTMAWLLTKAAESVGKPFQLPAKFAASPRPQPPPSKRFGLPKEYTWHLYDPETVGFPMVALSDDPDLARRYTWAARLAQARIWDECGRPLGTTIMSREWPSFVMQFVLIDHWATPVIERTLEDTMVMPVELPPPVFDGLSDEQIVDALTGIGAQCWMPYTAAELTRPLHRLRQEYYDAVPEEAREHLSIES